jgi:hypothetical protein
MLFINYFADQIKVVMGTTFGTHNQQELHNMVGEAYSNHSRNLGKNK